MAAGFDYTTVWTNNLSSAKVTVHAKRGRFELVPDDERYSSVRTRCGKQRTFVQYRDDHRGVQTFATGVHLAAGHALTLGAHFCRLCWPELREANRG